MEVLKLLFSAAFYITLLLLSSCEQSTEPEKNLEDEQFYYVLYGGISSSTITGISKELENNYSRIITDLQVQSMPKITVKIWEDYDTFLDDMENDIGTRYQGATGYIYGMTEFRLYNTAQISLAAVHEFAHVVSMHVNPSITNNPRWLWEAVALYESQDFIDPSTLSYMVSGNYPTLSELSTDYNSSNHSIYSVGYVLLEYVVQTWGMETVISLIKNNGNITALLGISTKEFESGWYKFVKEKYLN